ncbi:AAA family ATPase [candidate division WOR-3 bacterium]|nr:AAA family ATPase [candidate division WOR-3 bacterium]
MIKKILKIKDVGKFANYSLQATSSWNGELSKTTIIYAENGAGKTTLSDIFRSLKDNNIKIIKARKTIGSIGPQEIEILTDSGKRTFKDDKWDGMLENIEIFDIFFVNENIYSGFEVSPAHKKALHKFIVGAEGVGLATEINNLKIKIEEEHKKLREIELKIHPYLKSVYLLEDFINLSEDVEIDKKIVEKKKEIETAEAYEEIKNKDLLKRLNLFQLAIDLTTLRTVLQKSITTISYEYLQKVEIRKRALGMGDESEDWLEKGHQHIRNNLCPFCLQNLDNAKEIIEAYNQYFNNEYKNLKTNISDLMSEIQKINITAKIDSIEREYLENNALFEFWKNHIKAKLSENNIFSDKPETIQKFNDLIKLVEGKNKAPLEKAETKIVDELEILLRPFNDQITNYNETTDLCNSKIQALKEKTHVDLGKLKTELLKLEVQKQRFDKEVIELCDEYNRQNSNIDKLNEEKEKKREELDQSTSGIFKKYGEKTNDYLRKFGTEFEIVETKGGSYVGRSKDPMAEYKLNLSGQEILFDDDEINPCFKYTLSEGDKRSLAFALFLAKLDLDHNYSDKVIIFDDPLSSLDSNRRTATTQQLQRLSSLAKQMIILTHNTLFARTFWNGIDKSKCKNLQIVRSAETYKISEWDLEKETSGEYFNSYFILEKYLNEGVSNQELRNVARCIRPLLEGYLRVKFPGKFGKGLGYFIKKIENALTGDPLVNMKPQLNELRNINDFSKKYHHGDNPGADYEPITDAELKNFVDRTLNFLGIT